MSEQNPGAPAPTGGEPPKPIEAPPKPAEISMTNEAFNRRLAEERASHEKTLLKNLGTETFDAAKARIDAATKLEQSALSETEKLNLRIKELEPFQASAERIGARFKAQVEAEFTKLPAAAQAAIDEHAKGDAEKRFDLIDLMRKSGALDAFTKSSEPPKPPPLSNGGPPPAPPPSGAQTAFQKFESMKASSPLMADIFYQSNSREIERTRPAA
jgi:hypothetical protein